MPATSSLNIFVATALFVAVTGCVSSGVSGQVGYKDEAGKITEKYSAECEGQCKTISQDGKCIEFAAGISNICMNYLIQVNNQKGKKVNNSVFIGP